MNPILIVDDEPAIRALLARWLGDAKYPTMQAPDAETGLEMMATTQADVVFCDVEMPGKGGLWLVAQLRERYPTSAVVLATSVDSIPGSISLQGGVVNYLTKPFSRQRVLSAVSESLRWRQSAVASASNERNQEPDPVDTWLDKTR